jgi:hypothetical protein
MIGIMQPRNYPSRIVPPVVVGPIVALVVAVCLVVPQSGAAVPNIAPAAATPTPTVVGPTAATVPPERTIPRPVATKKAKTVTRRKTVTTKRPSARSKSTVATKRTTPTATANATSSPGTVRATISSSGALVAIRTEPDPHSTLMRRIPDRTTVAIRCQVVGAQVNDPALGRTSGLWNQLTTGGYVSNIYTSLYKVGETGPRAPLTLCGSTAAGKEQVTPTSSGTALRPVPAKTAVTAVS